MESQQLIGRLQYDIFPKKEAALKEPERQYRTNFSAAFRKVVGGMQLVNWESATMVYK
ncbi:MAG: hypothetical protein ACJAT1_000704 [Marivirga sp.]|jgi:hypothetical protein